jgi:predicted kinase
MSKVIVTIGIQGSGKTTAMKAFAERYGYSYLSPDGIREELLGNPYDKSRNDEVRRLLRERAKEFLANNQTFIVDSTLVNQEQRTEFLQFLRENGATKIQGVFFDTPLEIARERTLKRTPLLRKDAIDEYHADLQKSLPQTSDGFDALFTLDEFQGVESAELAREGDISVEKNFGRSH